MKQVWGGVCNLEATRHNIALNKKEIRMLRWQGSSGSGTVAGGARNALDTSCSPRDPITHHVQVRVRELPGHDRCGAGKWNKCSQCLTVRGACQRNATETHAAVLHASRNSVKVARHNWTQRSYRLNIYFMRNAVRNKLYRPSFL